MLASATCLVRCQQRAKVKPYRGYVAVRLQHFINMFLTNGIRPEVNARATVMVHPGPVARGNSPSSVSHPTINMMTLFIIIYFIQIF
jgi:hypothetical protein